MKVSCTSIFLTKNSPIYPMNLNVYSESDMISMKIFTINFSTYNHSYAAAIDEEKQEKYSIKKKEYKYCL